MRLQETPLWGDVVRSYPHLADKFRELTLGAYAGCSKFPWFRVMLVDVESQEPELLWDTMLGTVVMEYHANPALFDDDAFQSAKYGIIQATERVVSRTLRKQYVTRNNQSRRVAGGEVTTLLNDSRHPSYQDTSHIDDSIEDTAELMFPGLNDLEHAVLCSFAETGSFLVTADAVGITPRRVGIIVERLRNRYGTGDYGLVLSADR